jgi:hypothetical protein
MFLQFGWLGTGSVIHNTFSCNFVLGAFTGVAACIEADLTAEESYELEARVSTLDI